MRTLDVIIMKGGCTAREINPLGDKPKSRIPVSKMKKEVREKFQREMKEWKEAEKKRRVFHIDFSHLVRLFKAFEKALDAKIDHVHVGFDEGMHQKAQLLHNGKLRIL